MIKGLEHSGTPQPDIPATEEAITLDRDNVVVEASPLPSFDPAAALFPRARRIDVPPEIWRTYRSDVLYLRVVESASGAALATFARRKMGS